MPAPKQGLKHTPLWQQHLQTPPSGSTCSSTRAPPASLQSVHTTLTASNTLHQHLAAALQRHHDARSKARTPLWKKNAQRQQHASSRALHVWYNHQQLKRFQGKCGQITIRGGCRETLNHTKSRSANHTHESYPRIIPRIIPPSQTSRVGHGILRHTHMFTPYSSVKHGFSQYSQAFLDSLLGFSSYV